MDRRFARGIFLLRWTLTIAACLVLAPAGAQSGPADYPNKPLRIINPFSTGGTTDTLARLLGDEITKAWGQPVVVESKPGAAGNIGTQFVARSAPDGYTMVLGTQGTHGTNMLLFRDLPYDAFRDFTPVTMVAAAPLILVVNPKLPVNSVQELVAYVKSRPEGLTYASTSPGSSPHLAAEMFARAAGIKLVHVPYKGSGPAKTDLLGGHVGLLFDNIGSSLGAVKAGQLRGLAVTGAARSAAAPDIPTMAESGYPGYLIDSWYVLAVPSGTPGAVVGKLNSEVVRILKDPQISERIRAMGVDVVASTPAQAADRMRDDLERYGKVIRDAGIPAQ